VTPTVASRGPSASILRLALLACFALWSPVSRAQEATEAAPPRALEEITASCSLRSPECGGLGICYPLGGPRVCGPLWDASGDLWIYASGQSPATSLRQGQPFSADYTTCNVDRYRVELCSESGGCSLVRDWDATGPWTVPACHPPGTSRVFVSGMRSNSSDCSYNTSALLTINTGSATCLFWASADRADVPQGQTQVIRWSSQNQSAFRLYLQYWTGTAWVAKDMTPWGGSSDGYFAGADGSVSALTWTVPRDLPTASYRVRVVIVGVGSSPGAETPFFSVSPVPAVSNVVAAPALLHAGDVQRVTWSSISQQSREVRRCDASGLNCTVVGAKASSTAQEFSWTVPSGTPAGSYRMKVVVWSSLNVATEALSGLFSIESDAPTAPPAISSFTASTFLLNRGATATLTWTATSGATLTLNGSPVGGPTGTLSVTPASTTSYTLVASNTLGSVSRSITVVVGDGVAGLPAPAVSSPGDNQVLVVYGVTFSWASVTGASGYDMRVVDETAGRLVFSGSLAGVASTSTLVTVPAGRFRFGVRACSGGFGGPSCGAYGTVPFKVEPVGPSAAPVVTSPAPGSVLTTSVQALSWTPVAPNPLPLDMRYEVRVEDVTAGATALQISNPQPLTSTIFTFRSSNHYRLTVRACQTGCGPDSEPVDFAVSLGPVPSTAPSITGASVAGGNSLSATWTAVPQAEFYRVQVVQPGAGPGGGALSVAAGQVSATSVVLPVPAGSAAVFVAACNGDGCGPDGGPSWINAPGPSPSSPILGTPMSGSVVNGPSVLFTWNRVPGDDGSNTIYRLYAQDMSRQSAALDVYTTNNYHGAYFKAEGSRYDALVIARPGPSQLVGPASGFNVAGSSPSAPTMVAPTHQGSVSQGNVQVGWTPLPGATLYEYYVAMVGRSEASARGVTTGLAVYVPLTAAGGAATGYSAIVRACRFGQECRPESDAGWGPWSNAPGGPGVTTFTVLP
jgi:hypothetical protein